VVFVGTGCRRLDHWQTTQVFVIKSVKQDDYSGSKAKCYMQLTTTYTKSINQQSACLFKQFYYNNVLLHCESL